MTVTPRPAPSLAIATPLATVALVLAWAGLPPPAQAQVPAPSPVPRTAPTSTSPAPTPAALPPANFWIDLREIDEPVQVEAAGGAVGTVLGTARATAGGGVASSRADPGGDGPLDTHLRLANGAQGRLVWQQARAQDRVAAAWTGEGAGPPGTAAGSTGVRLQREWLTSGRQIVLAARWPGGEAPVAVELSLERQGIEEPGATGAVATRTASTTTQVLARLDQWVTVTRSAAPDSAPAQGAISSTRREAAPATLLQLRVRLAAPLAALPKPLPR